MSNSYFEHVNKGKPYSPYIGIYDKNLRFPAHYHEEVEILYLHRGRMTVNINGAGVVLEEGEIFVISPGDIHSMTAQPDSLTSVFKFYTPKPLYRFDITGKIGRDNVCRDSFGDILNEIIDEYTKKAPGFEIAVSALADRFFLMAIRRLCAPILDDSQKAAKRKYIELLNKITDYCENRYEEQIRLADISAECGYSQYHFSRIFRKVTSMSFPDFLSSFRIEKAKERLYYNTSVSKVAYECGFNNLRSFNRAFRKNTGITPREYIADLGDK